MASLAEKVSVGILVVVGAAYAALPNRVSRLLSPGIALIVDGLTWADATLPRPLFISLIFLATTIASLLIAMSFGRVLYTLLKHGGPRTKRLLGFVTPSTPVGKVVLVLAVVVLFLLGSVWGIPYFFG